MERLSPEAAIDDPSPMPDSGPPTTIAYIINQYPSPSHTFIRREIEALEQAGAVVTRIAIRSFPGKLVDPHDLAELSRTHQILAFGGVSLLLPLLRSLLLHPVRLLKTVAAALRFRRGGLADLLRHLAYVAEACAAMQHVTRANATHLHAHFGSNSAMVALLCEHLGGPRFSLTIHGPEEFEDPLGHRLTEKIAAARFVVGISEHGVRLLRQFTDTPEKIKLIRCGVDGEYLADAPTPPPSDARILFIGRFHERKNPDLVQRAVLQLRDEGIAIHATYIGDGPMLEAQRRRSVQAGLVGKSETYLGWSDAKTIRDEIRKSRVVVLPSRAEGLPVVLMEAMALGRPVIASDVGGVGELVQPGINGWLIPSGNLDALTAAIREAAAAPIERLDDMGRAGRQRVLALHDSRANAEQLLALIRA